MSQGVWNPVKNFPDCKPVCDKTCLNGGTCIGPDVCGCPPEYKGPRCEFYSLNCDIRNLTSDVKISWVCTQSNNETSCRVKCKTPFEFETPTEEVYKCSQDGVWTPPTIPECISPDMAATTTETSEGKKKKI
ncbi:uncharacterized protein TNCT_141821 [Trichonephila clavata]|uniref:EGF-like domain-containing protein n=1 Tax=Trichonephila clavata TaxID=2740835 RepID=A0A8X6M3L8_TRICU|nr:uncharacterized protein TNCT_141821 [Trichonephila clavata]